MTIPARLRRKSHPCPTRLERLYVAAALGFSAQPNPQTPSANTGTDIMALTGLLPGAVVTFHFLSFSARMFICKMELHVFLLLLIFLYLKYNTSHRKVLCA